MKFKRLHPDAVSPKYCHKGDSGFDLFSIENAWIHNKRVTKIRTGLAFDVPEGFELQIRSKSGRALKDAIIVVNSPGTVDSSYTGEICVLLSTLQSISKRILVGDKIAQAVLVPVKTVEFEEVDELKKTTRRSDGFGSTGIKEENNGSE
jgi:dUTP pyrophosphatase